MNGKITLEIYYRGQWQTLGEITVRDDLGSIFSPSRFAYDMGFYNRYGKFHGERGIHALSLQTEFSLIDFDFSHWIPILLDLIPQGAARIAVCKRERIVDNPQNDFIILSKGAVNPIGNVRVKSNYPLFEGSRHKGFAKTDILEKKEQFLEHATKFGALVVGTSGAQGMAPKFLVNIDKVGRFHCDGALQDKEVKKSLLVKFPRGKSNDDVLILQSEKIYMDIALALSLKGNKGLEYINQCLFIPRFDRDVQSKVRYRLGVESLSSALGHEQFGKKDFIENCLKVIQKYSTKAKEDMLEFIRRDFLNIIMGNTDNHARNTAFIKYSETEVRLSPLFDFAPMVMDPEMIPRSITWQKEERYIPDFQHIETVMLSLGFTAKEIDSFFHDWMKKIKKLPALFTRFKLPKQTKKNATRLYPYFVDQLEQYLKDKTNEKKSERKKARTDARKTKKSPRPSLSKNRR